MTKENNDISVLRRDYDSLKTKYSLPDFEELIIEFDIEKIAEKEKESSLVLREVRRGINEKISAYMHLFETFMNPSSGPVFVFSMLKNIADSDKKKIKEIYQRLAKIEIGVFKLDTIYSEENEAKFIKSIAGEWAALKKEIYTLIEKLDEEFSIVEDKVSKGYFG